MGRPGWRGKGAGAGLRLFSSLSSRLACSLGSLYILEVRNSNCDREGGKGCAGRPESPTTAAKTPPSMSRNGNMEGMALRQVEGKGRERQVKVP